MNDSDTPGGVLCGVALGNIVELDAFRDPSAVLVRECVELFVQMHELRMQIEALGGGAYEIDIRERAYRERFNRLCQQIAEREPRIRSSRAPKPLRYVP